MNHTGDNGVCGEPTEGGGTCQRDAGWGTDRDDGPCRDHAHEYHNPKKLTPEVKNNLLGAAQEGAFKKHCAQLAGITEQTLRNWLTWGEEDVYNDLDSPCADLYLAFQRARGTGAVRRLKEADTEFILERSYGYTKTETREVTGEGGGPVEHEHGFRVSIGGTPVDELEQPAAPDGDEHEHEHEDGDAIPAAAAGVGDDDAGGRDDPSVPHPASVAAMFEASDGAMNGEGGEDEGSDSDADTSTD